MLILFVVIIIFFTKNILIEKNPKYEKNYTIRMFVLMLVKTEVFYT